MELRRAVGLRPGAGSADLSQPKPERMARDDEFIVKSI